MSSSSLKRTRTYSPRPADIHRQWHIIDAEGQILGRMAVQIAKLLMGKNKPIYAPHMDTGDYVIVLNAKKVKATGNKLQDKLYHRHSGYPGGLRSVPLGEMLEAHPTRAIELAVKGMLPHNALGRTMLRKLKVYPGPDHPHEAQAKAEEKED
ncbi:MAG: 50S ribosomal protein L13 [Chloroflexi bacterium]|nr:50S ribosomal protein L13 [Chloroflexota bacterium]